MDMALCSSRRKLIIIIISTFIFAIASSSAEQSSQEAKTSSHLDLYKRLFELKRKEQIETAERVWKVEDYAHQYKTINYLMDAIFPVLRNSLKKLLDENFSPDQPFPEDQEMQDTLGKVYENVIFFGDFVLRMPDITKKIYKQQKGEWMPILVRAVEFCRESVHVITGPHATHLHLMSQELGLIPEDPDYVNPFRKSHRTREEFTSNESMRKKPGMVKDKKEKTRGPKLRGGRHSKMEL